MTYTQNIANLMALFTLGSFAVQQALQILDWIIVWFIAVIKANCGLPGGMLESDFKKSVMPTVGFGLGLIFVRCAHIGLLKLLPALPSDLDYADSFLTALAISAGTDGVNTVLKFIGYAKDARKPDDVTITVTPSSVSVVKGGTVQFQARVSDGTAVTWSVVETTTGGTVLPTGLYTAPNTTGTYHVACARTSDLTRTTLATITVTN